MSVINYSAAQTLEKKTFTLHLISQFFNGVTLGIVLLQDIILKKSLFGSDFQVMLLAFLVSSSFLFSIYGSEFINRSRNRPKTIPILGTAAKLFIIILPLFDNPLFYIACIAFSAYIDSMLLSMWNIVFKHNYREENRSKLYSWASSLQTLVVVIVTTAFGYYLDINASFYKIMFPVAGLCGIVTYYNLAKMVGLSADDYSGKTGKTKKYISFRLFKDILTLPFRITVKVFKDNPSFFRFEAYFFLYGVAFMVLSPVIPVFLVDDLQLSYSPISFAKGLVFHSAFILFSPVMGKYHGSKNPTRFCGIVFSILAAFPLMLVSAKYFSAINLDKDIILYASFFVFGIAMSGVTIAWSLGSIFYAPQNQVSNYQAVHVTLTGIRGLFSPALGYAVMKILAIEYSFYLSAILFLTGGILMYRESRK